MDGPSRPGFVRFNLVVKVETKDYVKRRLQYILLSDKRLGHIGTCVIRRKNLTVKGRRGESFKDTYKVQS